MIGLDDLVSNLMILSFCDDSMSSQCECFIPKAGRTGDVSHLSVVI